MKEFKGTQEQVNEMTLAYVIKIQRENDIVTYLYGVDKMDVISNTNRAFKFKYEPLTKQQFMELMK